MNHSFVVIDSENRTEMRMTRLKLKVAKLERKQKRVGLVPKWGRERGNRRGEISGIDRQWENFERINTALPSQGHRIELRKLSEKLPVPLALLTFSPTENI